MSPIFIIVVYVFFQYSPQMPFIENDGVIETISSNRTDDSLDIGVLPGRMGCDQNLLNVQC